MCGEHLLKKRCWRALLEPCKWLLLLVCLPHLVDRPLQVPDASESDPELPAKQQAALLASAMRTMALPLGRGAFTFGLSQLLPGEHIMVPLLCLSGLVAGPGGTDGSAGGKILVNLDLTNAQPAPGKRHLGHTLSTTGCGPLDVLHARAFIMSACDL
jgi:hypothetical protein